MQNVTVPDQTFTSSAPLHQRTDAEFARAKRHQRQVGWLKRALPAAAICVVLAFGALSALSFNPFATLDIAGIGLEDGKLVMREPKLEGVDRNDRPFTVQANSAQQDLDQPDLIELNAIAAELADDAGSQTQVEAKTGLYNAKSEQLVLSNGVNVRGANGLDIQLDNADIDMKTGVMTSENPVSVTSRDGRVTADSVQVKDNGKRIIFKERVRMVIDRPQTPSAEIVENQTDKKTDTEEDPS
jgi:lipopolysaccharide export system protein LptC